MPVHRDDGPLLFSLATLRVCVAWPFARTSQI